MCSWTAVDHAEGPSVRSDYSALSSSCRCDTIGNQMFNTFNHKTVMPKLSPLLLNYLQKFVTVRSNLSSSYEMKISNLLSVWKECVGIFNEDTCSGSHIFMHYAASESAFLILLQEWSFITNETKNQFVLVLNQIKDKLKVLKSHLESITNCDCLMSLVKSPWKDHGCLVKLTENEPTIEEVANFMRFEKSSIYALRLKILCENKDEELALKLSTLAMLLYHEKKFVATYYCDYEDVIFIREIYFACLKMFDSIQLVKQLNTYNLQNGGKQLFERCCKRMSSLTSLTVKNEPRILDNISHFSHLATTFIVCCSLQNDLLCDDASEYLNKWCYSINNVLQHETLTIKKRVQYIMEFSNLAIHCYLLGNILYTHFGSKLPITLYIEIYTQALYKNITEKEEFNRSNNKDGAFESLKMLVRGYIEFANILENVFSLRRECVLTAFSLMPSKDLMVKVKKLAKKSRKLYPTRCKSTLNLHLVHSESLWTKKLEPKWFNLDSNLIMHSELKDLPDPLSESVKQDLNYVLKCPRHCDFNWNLNWSKLKSECEKLINNFDSVLNQNILVAPSLQFNSMNIHNYNNYWNYKKINKSNVDADEFVESSALSRKRCTVIIRKNSMPASRKRKSVTRKQQKSDPLKRMKTISQSDPNKSAVSSSISLGSYKTIDDSTVSSSFNEKASNVTNSTVVQQPMCLSGGYFKSIMSQLTSSNFLRPANVDYIVNVVQIHTTTNPLTNVSQTQTENGSNLHSTNVIEKKTDDNQSSANALENFASVYQPNSLNNNINYVQSSDIRQGECSFSENGSVSNKKITDLTSNTDNIGQLETNKSIGTLDVLLNKNQTSLEHHDIQLKNSNEEIIPTVGNSINSSSNLIIQTSNVSPSHAITGHITNTTKKLTYCVKTHDQFIDLTLPASISSTSTNSDHSNLLSTMNSKRRPNSPVQTSVGLQVNFNNQHSESIHTISPNVQSSQICTKSAKNTTSTMSVLKDQKVNSTIIRTSTSSNLPIVNSVLSTQTQTCSGLRSSKEVFGPNVSVMSLMVNSTQSQDIKTSMPNSLYTTSQNQIISLSNLGNLSQTNRSDEQKKIDHLKLISQTFTATSEAIKFVTSNTESQRLIQSTDKCRVSDLPVFQNITDCVSSISQEHNFGSKLLNRGRGNMRTYESKTRALKQANMSDMYVFEKGTLYAVQDDNQMESTKTIPSPKHFTTHIKIQNSQVREIIETPKSPINVSPNITITGSMLPRFQQVFGKTKFQSSTAINDTSSLGPTSVPSTPSILGPVINRTLLSSRVFSSSKGVQTNHDVDQINSKTNCLVPKSIDNKLQRMVKSDVATVGNNKNNVIMTCKTISSLKSIPQVSASSSHHLVTSNVDRNNGVEKKNTGTPLKDSLTLTTNCSNNSSSTSSNADVNYSIPIQSDVKSVNHVEKPFQNVTQTQKQLKMSPSIIQTVLRKYPNWQQHSLREGKQSIEVQTSPSVQRLVPVNVSSIVKTTIESLSNKDSVSTRKPNVTETNVSPSMMEQMREFESVLEEVRKNSLMNEMNSTSSMLPQISHEIIEIQSPTENVDLLNTDNNQTLFPLNKKLSTNNAKDRCAFSFLNQTLSNDLTNEEKEAAVVTSSVISVCSVSPNLQTTSPNNNLSANLVDGLTQCPKLAINNKSKPVVVKTPANSPSISAVKVPVLQKPLPKLQEDEQTTQRIYAILDKYAEQLRNSPELKNKPAPRRRTNPPTNPSLNSKRKKSNQLNLKTCSQQTSCSSSGMEMSPTSDMQAIDSDDSSNAVSNFSHIIDSPSRNPDEQSATIVSSETSLMENSLINVNDVIKKINIDAEKRSKGSQSTQIVVSGTSGPFLSIPEGSAGNVRLLVAAGKNQKMYRVHCPVFHQITKKDSCSSDVKVPSNIIGQKINEPTILSALTSDDLKVTNTSLGNEILLNTSQSSSVFEHKINKSDIILESMTKAQVLENNEKQLLYPVLKKSQASQSTFSVIHSIPYKSRQEPNCNVEIVSETQNNILESVQSNYCVNDNKILSNKELNNKPNNQVLQQEKVNKTLKEGSPFIKPEISNNSGIPFENLEFPPFHSQKKAQQHNEDTSDINKKNSQQNIIYTEKQSIANQISVNSNNEILNDPMKCDDNLIEQKKISFNSENASKNLNITISKHENDARKPNVVLSDVAAASAAEIISTVNQSSNNYKQKENLKNVKTECESENENENTLSNTVYNLLDNHLSTSMNSKIGPLTNCLRNDWSAKNWNNCLSKIFPPGTKKLLEGKNLEQLQKSFKHTTIKTFKDLKMFVYEQCKLLDNNIETPKEYDLYDDVDGLGVDKPSKNELFPEVAILNDLDKSVSSTLSLLQASTSKSCDTSALQTKRKSVLSHTTTSTVTSTSTEHATHTVNKKMKTKVSFLKQALYNEMSQDSNDSVSKSFINGSNKSILESIEQQIDLSPGSPSNIITAVDSETCMSEDSTSTISSGTPHYNFRKSKRKNIEEDGFIESQVIKRMYRGRTSESEEKTEPPKLSSRVQTVAQKQATETKESNTRRISSRLKNNSVKSNQHTSFKSLQTESKPSKTTSTRASLRRVSRKSL